MGNYIGALVLLVTLAGVVWVILFVVLLFKRSRFTTFKKVVFGFAFAGVVIPAAILPVWNWSNHPGSFLFGLRIEYVALALWPTSIELMALDSPHESWSSIAFVYGFSLLGNVGLYGTLGVIAGWIFVSLPKHFENARRVN